MNPLRRLVRTFLPRGLSCRIRETTVWSGHILPRLQGWWYPDPPYGVDRRYEAEVTDAIQRIVQRGWVCADVGGFIGRHTALLAEIVGSDGRVVVFEPHPLNAGIIERHMRALGLQDRVRLERFAVDDGRRPKLWLYGGRQDDSSEFNIRGGSLEGRPTRRKASVRATSLDGYFGRTRLDFVKLDIEGAEAQALVGMRQLLREQKPIVIVEVHTDEAWVSVRCEIHAAGYALYGLSGHELTQNGDRISHVLAVPSVHPPEKAASN